MFKKIKYFIFSFLIISFFFLTTMYYFSDTNKKKSYRSFSSINERINVFTKKLPILEDDTKNIIEYAEQLNDKKKKKFNFWKLIETNE